MKHGYGVYSYAVTEDRYEGEYYNGLKSGHGKYTFGKTLEKYEGVFATAAMYVTIEITSITMDHRWMVERPDARLWFILLR